MQSEGGELENNAVCWQYNLTMSRIYKIQLITYILKTTLGTTDCIQVMARDLPKSGQRT